MLSFGVWIHLALSICFPEFTQKENELNVDLVYIVKVLKKMPKIDTFSGQNVLDLLLSLHVYIVTPKDLLEDQKILNSRRMKNN